MPIRVHISSARYDRDTDTTYGRVETPHFSQEYTATGKVSKERLLQILRPVIERELQQYRKNPRGNPKRASRAHSRKVRNPRKGEFKTVYRLRGQAESFAEKQRRFGYTVHSVTQNIDTGKWEVRWSGIKRETNPCKGEFKTRKNGARK